MNKPQEAFHPSLPQTHGMMAGVLSDLVQSGRLSLLASVLACVGCGTSKETKPTTFLRPAKASQTAEKTEGKSERLLLLSLEMDRAGDWGTGQIWEKPDGTEEIFWERRGMILVEGDPPGYIPYSKFIEEHISQDPFSQGSANLYIGEFQKAHTYLSLHIEESRDHLGRRDSRALVLRGDASQGLQDFDAAIRDYTDALQEGPMYSDNNAVRVAIGDAYYSSGDRERGGREWTQLLERSMQGGKRVDMAAGWRIAMAHKAEERFAEARAQLKMLLSLLHSPVGIVKTRDGSEIEECVGSGDHFGYLVLRSLQAMGISDQEQVARAQKLRTDYEICTKYSNQFPTSFYPDPFRHEIEHFEKEYRNNRK